MFNVIPPERSGWRDLELSQRHRTWGFNCPGVDIDFFLIEYNLAKPVGLVEYKFCMAEPFNLKHPSYLAMADLADGYRIVGLPFWVAVYWKEPWAFQITPGNEQAKKHFANQELLSEADYVLKLYRLRQQAFARSVADMLDKRLPSGKPMAVAA